MTRTVTVGTAAVEETEEDTTEDTTEETEETTTPVVTIVTNGRYVTVRADGVVVERVKISPTKLPDRYYLLKTAALYNNYTTVALLTTTRTTGRLRVWRLTASHELKKAVSRSFAITKRNRVGLAFKPAKHRITASVGKGTARTRQIFRLTAKGKLKSI